jgi:hypothetical protein
MNASLHESLVSMARRQARLDYRALATRLVAIGVGFGAFLVLVDALAGLTPFARAAALAAFVAIATATSAALVWPGRIGTRAIRSAAVRAGDHVLAAYELDEAGEGQQTEVRRVLVGRVTDRAVMHLGAIDQRAVLDRRPMHKAGAWLHVALLCALAVEVALPGATRSALVRIADPAHFHPAWSVVAFDVRTDPGEPLAGDDVLLTSRVEGGTSDVDLLLVGDDSANPAILDVLPLSHDAEHDDRWRGALRSVCEPTFAIVRRGGAMSRLVRIDPTLAPRVTRAYATINGADGAMRTADLSLGASTPLVLTPEETVRIELETTIAPARVQGGDEFATSLGPSGASVTIPASGAPEGTIALTPIGPEGDASPNSVHVEIRTAPALAHGEPTGAAEAIPEELADASGSMQPGALEGEPNAEGETTGEAGEPAAATEATPTIARGGGVEGPNRIAQGENVDASVESLALADAQRRAVEIIRAEAPVGDLDVGSGPPIPERYRALAARFFRRVVRDEASRGGGS